MKPLFDATFGRVSWKLGKRKIKKEKRKREKFHVACCFTVHSFFFLTSLFPSFLTSLFSAAGV